MRMPHYRPVFRDGAFGPTRLKALEEIFREVWLCVLPEVGHKAKDIETARVLLARIIFNLARDGQLGALQITRTAARLMRQYDATGVATVS
jgi:hypothetical protein